MIPRQRHLIMILPLIAGIGERRDRRQKRKCAGRKEISWSNARKRVPRAKFTFGSRRKQNLTADRLYEKMTASIKEREDRIMWPWRRQIRKQEDSGTSLGNTGKRKRTKSGRKTGWKDEAVSYLTRDTDGQTTIGPGNVLKNCGSKRRGYRGDG